MIRVLHVTRDFPPRINGGISTAVGGLVRHATAAGVKSSVISFDAWRPHIAKARGPATRHGDTLRLSHPSHLDAAAAFAREHAPQIVHVHHGMLWDFAASIPGARTIFTAHVAQAHARKLRGLADPTASERAQGRAIGAADIVSAPSEAARDVIAARARVIPLGVESAAQASAADGRPLYVGRFGDIKGTLELLQAVEQSGVDIVVAGGLPDNKKADARWRRRFAQRAPTAQLTGWLGPDELLAAYRRASFVVVPSWFETFGQVVAEAMQHGVPALASRVGGLVELDPEGLSTCFVPPRDVDALASGLSQNMTERRLAAREAGTRWSWSKRITPWLALYEELS